MNIIFLLCFLFFQIHVYEYKCIYKENSISKRPELISYQYFTAFCKILLLVKNILWYFCNIQRSHQLTGIAVVYISHPFKITFLISFFLRGGFYFFVSFSILNIIIKYRMPNLQKFYKHCFTFKGTLYQQVIRFMSEMHKL